MTYHLSAIPYPLLHSIDESFLDPVKYHNPDKQHNKHEAGAVGQANPGGVPGAQEAGAEGFDDRRNGVYVRHPAPLFGNAGDGVDNRSAVHPQADTETHKVLQVAIFGGHGRDDDTEAKSQSRHQQDQ